MTENIDDKIEDIFYTDIIPSIVKGKTTIDEVNYRTNYNVKILDKFVGDYNPDIPTLVIENVDEFNKYLVMYINKHSLFLHESDYLRKDSFLLKDVNEQIRYSLMNLFINATSNDFNNPIEYLKNRISFFDNDLLYEKFPVYEKIYNLDDIDCHIESCVFKQHPANETPYAFFSRIVSNDGENTYDLPKIRYGIKDDGYKKEVYIYAIQGSKKKSVLNKFEKKINRYLFKINKDVVKDEEYLQYEKDSEMELDSFFPENVIDVTPKSVLSLTIFLKIIKDMGINKVTVIDYLPIRYYGNLHGKKAVVDLYKGIYSEEELNQRYNQAEKQMDDNQFNITNKFIRTFNRVNYHLNNMSNITYPFEVDDKMHFIINDEMVDNDHLINNVYNGINIENKKRK